MFFSFSKLLVAGLSFTLIPASLFAIRSNDFTKSNSNFSRKYESTPSDLANQRATAADKKFETKPYGFDNKVSNLTEEESRFSRTDNVSDIRSKRDYRSGKMYEKVSDYTPKRERWINDGMMLKHDNLTRDLNKEYRGRFVDKSLKSRFSTDEIRHNYEEMLERSIGDINKYQYGASRQSASEAKDAIPIQKAGKGNEEEKGGIFDFLSSDTNITRPAVSFKGSPKISPVLPDSANEQKPETSVKTANSVNAPQATVPNGRVATPALERSANPVGSVSVDKRTGARRVLKSVTEVESSLDILRKVPEDWRAGKPQIKIEINE